MLELFSSAVALVSAQLRGHPWLSGLLAFLFIAVLRHRILPWSAGLGARNQFFAANVVLLLVGIALLAVFGRVVVVGGFPTDALETVSMVFVLALPVIVIVIAASSIWTGVRTVAAIRRGDAEA